MSKETLDIKSEVDLEIDYVNEEPMINVQHTNRRQADPLLTNFQKTNIVYDAANVKDDVSLHSNHFESEESPWHVESWMHTLPTAASLSKISKVDAKPKISFGPPSDEANATDDVRPTTSTLPLSTTNNAGSDIDSEVDDELGIEMAAAGSEWDISNDEDIDEPIRNIIKNVERGMDDAIESLPGLSTKFLWVKDFNSFRGFQEEFSGPNPGPVKDYNSPLEAFTDIFDENIFELIVRETNRYAKQSIDDLKDKGELKQTSRLHRWIDTNVEEMKVFFGVLMFMGIDSRSSLTEYWQSGGVLEMPNFKALMSSNRYILLNKFLHFIDNSDSQNYHRNTEMYSGDKAMQMRLSKLSPLLTHLNRKFSSLYNLKRSISIDQSLLLCSQRINSAAALFGIKSHELCDSVTGYMARFRIYAGVSSSGSNSDEALSIEFGRNSVKIILELLKGLERRGHSVTLNNFYNCPSLARYLKSQGFDCLGTLRSHRRHVPNEITLSKNVSKGTVVARHSGDVSITACKDSKVVSIISTYHDDCIFGKNARVAKPKCVDEYNRTKAGLYLKDRKLSMYLLERKRCAKWYVKVFKRFLNVSIHNAYVLYVEGLKRHNKLPITHREFRYALAELLVRQHLPRQTHINQGVGGVMRLRRDIVHEPKYKSGSKNRKRCVICSRESHRRLVNSQCVTCGVFLCFNNCWKTWHSSQTVKNKKMGGKRQCKD